jgi:O-antigen ligase
MPPSPPVVTQRVDRDPADHRSTLRVAAAAVLAWALLSLAALVAGDPDGVGRSGFVLLVVVGAVALAQWRVARLASLALLGLYAGALTAATLLAGGTTIGAGDAARIQLFMGNPNVLGAALVTALTAWAAVAPRRRWVLWAWPLVGLAVLHTGSRTSGGALVAAGALWLALQAVRGRPKLVLAPLLVLIVLAAAALAWQRGIVELTPNLLAAPSDLSDPAWRHDLADHVTITDGAAPGPFPETAAQRLVAQARPTGRNLVHQSIGRSEEGVPYVASVYLRADTPQRIALSSHLAQVVCDVGPAWGRCVTPVGYGDDHAQRQLHLRATERGGSVDVFVFGAQYERGVEVTPFLDGRPSWVPQTMVNRFDLRRVTFLPENRMIAWTAGAEIAREHPWFGMGLEASQEAFRERTRDALSRPVTYAHNLAIQGVAVHGVVGVLGAALVVIALLGAVGRTGLARLAPMLVALTLLNTWDVTFFEWPVFVPMVLATAFWTARRSAPP